MYKDYYAILEVPYSASHQEIKKQYRLLAKKWHPDVNKSKEATSRMQEIIEAYLILSDNEARERYNKIHEFYFRQRKEEPKETQFETKTGQTKDTGKSDDDIPKGNNKTRNQAHTDPILDDWIIKAKKQARDFVLQSIQDITGITLRGCKYTVYAIGVTIIIFISVIIFILIWSSTQ